MILNFFIITDCMLTFTLGFDNILFTISGFPVSTAK